MIVLFVHLTDSNHVLLLLLLLLLLLVLRLPILDSSSTTNSFTIEECYTLLTSLWELIHKAAKAKVNPSSSATTTTTSPKNKNNYLIEMINHAIQYVIKVIKVNENQTTTTTTTTTTTSTTAKNKKNKQTTKQADIEQRPSLNDQIAQQLVSLFHASSVNR